MFRENYQLNNSFTIDTQASKECQSCGLCCNQPPLIEKKNKAEVFWVGLSAVKISPGENESPLSVETNTGSILNQIEHQANQSTNFYKTNLVKCLPLKNNKIRYPKVSEMEHCFTFLKKEVGILKPQIIFLLGKQVSTFVLKKYGVANFDLDPNFEYSVFNFENITYVPIHHPSYIFVYKRKKIKEFISGVLEQIRKTMISTETQNSLYQNFISHNSYYIPFTNSISSTLSENFTKEVSHSIYYLT